MAIPVAARRKVMLAASTVQTPTPREAAIVGGITRCIIETGGMDPRLVRKWTADIIAHFALVGVDRRLPGDAELSMAITKFEEHFGRRVA